MISETTIKNAIIDMIDALKNLTDSQEAKERNAELVAKIIADAIKSADIQPLDLTIPILPVQVVPASGTGATVAPVPTVTILGTGKLI